jgi:hypothetical protein
LHLFSASLLIHLSKFSSIFIFFSIAFLVAARREAFQLLAIAVASGKLSVLSLLLIRTGE